MELERYSTVGVIHVRVRVRARFIRARVSAIYPHCLTYLHAYGIESNPAQLNNDSTFLFFLYSFFFQFFYISWLFHSFFQNGRLQFK